jgi:hypothetical protein
VRTGAEPAGAQFVVCRDKKRKERYGAVELVSDNGGSRGASIEEDTRQANSNLKRLIDGIGGVLTASGELLMRLQQILGGPRPPAARSNEAGDRSAPPARDRGDC